MSINVASKTGINNGRRDIPYAVPTAITPVVAPTYTRPSDWLALPTVLSSESKFVGLYAVYDLPHNGVAILCTTTSGTYTVDWGDGVVDVVASNTLAQHDYDYTTISPTTLSSRGYRQAIVTVTPTTGEFVTISIHQKYKIDNVTPTANYSTKWLDIVCSGPNLTGVSLSSTTPAPSSLMLEQFSLLSCNSGFRVGAYFFSGCAALQSVPVFDISTVTVLHDYGSMFVNCYGLLAVPSSIDFSKTNSAFQMFSGCNSLIYVPENLDFSEATNTRFMFNLCSSLTTVPFFNTGKSTNFQSMFANCINLKAVPLYDTSKSTSMATTFSNCSNLQAVPLFNTILVIDMTSMFSNCYSLKSVPNFNTSNVATFITTFNNCRSLVDVPDLNCIKATDMNGTFTNCASMVNGPLLSNTSLVTNFQSTFNGCVSMITIDTFDTSNATNFSSTFLNCSWLQKVPNLNTSKGTNFTSTFSGCVSIKTIPTLNTINATNMTSTFSGCSSLQSIPSLNTSNATNTASMFNNCSSLESIPSMDTTKVANMNSMFNGCGSLVDVSGITNTSNNINMATMFTGCSSLTTLPIDTWNTSNVTSFNGTFNGCNSLCSIGTFDTSKSTSFNNMFINTALSYIPPLDMRAQTTVISNFANSSVVVNDAFGQRSGYTVSSNLYDQIQLENIFTNLGTVGTATLTVNGNPGLDSIVSTGCSAGQAVGTTTLTVNNSGVYTVGMYVYNAFVGLAPVAVTFQAGAGTVTKTSHGLANGTRVSFPTIVTTTGITINTVYYVINATTNTFQLSDTSGGTAKTLTNNGTGTMRYEVYIVSIPNGTQVVLSAPTGAVSTTVALSGRFLNMYLAFLKNWTVV